MKAPNIFVYYHEKSHPSPDTGIGAGWENLLTQVTAFYLSCDREALCRLVRHIVGDETEEPISVSPQVGGEYGTPDVVIDCRSKKRLVLENKIDSPLGKRQLENYLASLEPDGGYLALFSKKQQQISQEVRRHSLYRRPPDRDHYSWQDFYRILPSGSSAAGLDPLREHFRNYLSWLGFAPSSLSTKWQLLFEDRTVPKNREVQREFGRRLGGVRHFLADRDFKVGQTSHKGLSAKPPRPRRAAYLRLIVRPDTPRGALLPSDQVQLGQTEVLAVGLVYDSPSPPEHARRLYAEFPPAGFRDEFGNHWVAVPPYKMSNDRTRLEFAAPLERFLAGGDDVGERLTSGVRALLNEVWRLEKSRSRKSRPDRNHPGKAGRP